MAQMWYGSYSPVVTKTYSAWPLTGRTSWDLQDAKGTPGTSRKDHMAVTQVRISCHCRSPAQTPVVPEMRVPRGQVCLAEPATQPDLWALFKNAEKNTEEKELTVLHPPSRHQQLGLCPILSRYKWTPKTGNLKTTLS